MPLIIKEKTIMLEKSQVHSEILRKLNKLIEKTLENIANIGAICKKFIHYEAVQKAFFYTAAALSEEIKTLKEMSTNRMDISEEQVKESTGRINTIIEQFVIKINQLIESYSFEQKHSEADPSTLKSQAFGEALGKILPIHEKDVLDYPACYPFGNDYPRNYPQHPLFHPEEFEGRDIIVIANSTLALLKSSMALRARNRLHLIIDPSEKIIKFWQFIINLMKQYSNIYTFQAFGLPQILDYGDLSSLDPQARMQAQMLDQQDISKIFLDGGEAGFREVRDSLINRTHLLRQYWNSSTFDSLKEILRELQFTLIFIVSNTHEYIAWNEKDIRKADEILVNISHLEPALAIHTVTAGRNIATRDAPHPDVVIFCRKHSPETVKKILAMAKEKKPGSVFTDSMLIDEGSSMHLHSNSFFTSAPQSYSVINNIDQSFRKAVFAGDLQKMKKLWASGQVDINSKGEKSGSALNVAHERTKRNKHEVIKFLEACGFTRAHAPTETNQPSISAVASPMR